MGTCNSAQGSGTLLPTGQSYLALATEASLLQAGPDALDSPSVLRVAVGVPTGALVLQHQCVVHKACSETEAGIVRAGAQSWATIPKGCPGRWQNIPRREWSEGQFLKYQVHSFSSS
jgi:hypothetical protein